MISYSNDGLKWSKIKKENKNIRGITSGKNIFVAVGDEGLIFTSVNGVVWNEVKTNEKFNLSTVIYANNQFIAAGDSGTVITSSDGVKWNEKYTTLTFDIKSIIWGKDSYVAVGYGDLNKGIISTSNDLEKWTNTSVVGWLNDIEFNGKQYVAIGADNALYSSSDAIKWKRINWTNTYPPFWLYSIEKSPKGFLISGVSWDYKPMVLVSIDGIKWTQKNLPTNRTLFKIIWDGKKYIGVGEGGYIAKSGDGSKWENIIGGYNVSSITGLAYSGKQLVAVGNAIEGGSVLTSTDSITWSESSEKLTKFFGGFNDIAWNGKRFIAVASFDTIITSTDGKRWMQNRRGSYPHYRSIASNGKISLVVGDDGRIISSYDGIKWSEIENGNKGKRNTSEIIWTGKEFVTMGYYDEMLVSLDGLKWEKRYTNTEIYINSLSYNGRKYVAVGGLNDSGFILTSIDGYKWSKKILDVRLNKVIWNGQYFIAVGAKGTILLSLDGENWIQEKSGTSAALSDVIWFNNKFVITGSDRTILVGTKQ